MTVQADLVVLDGRTEPSHVLERFSDVPGSLQTYAVSPPLQRHITPDKMKQGFSITELIAAG